MTTIHAFPVLGCPACNAPLSGAASCPACGLRLVGPDAQLLWELDRRLAPLLVERDLLLGRLRGAAGPHGTTGPAGATVSGALGRTWVTLGLVGLLFVGIGTTYEARRRDLDRARAKLGVLH